MLANKIFGSAAEDIATRFANDETVVFQASATR